jgi:hypothetical protein
MMLSLLYISRSRLSGSEVQSQLHEILDLAARRNIARGITGALVHTGSDFAQVLEGPEAEVAQVMASILIDGRHDCISIVNRDEVPERSFPNWGMVLIGHLAQTQHQIDAIWHAADEASQKSAIDALVAWMRQGASARIAP